VEEGALLEAARRGDREALGMLLSSQYDRCYAVCKRLLGNEEDARDATQEAMISIARGLGAFDRRSKLSTWCYRVAANAALDELRRRQRRSRLEVPEDEDFPDDWPHDVARPVRDVADSVADRVSIDDALENLPHDQRVAVVLRDLADLDYAEIAEMLDLPMGTVRSRISRGRAALAGLLEGGHSRTPAVIRSSRNPEPPGHVQTDSQER
jgi:RNA polymerase sigma-70 factor (ECF subfamily)